MKNITKILVIQLYYGIQVQISISLYLYHNYIYSGYYVFSMDV